MPEKFHSLPSLHVPQKANLKPGTAFSDQPSAISFQFSVISRFRTGSQTCSLSERVKQGITPWHMNRSVYLKNPNVSPVYMSPKS